MVDLTTSWNYFLSDHVPVLVDITLNHPLSINKSSPPPYVPPFDADYTILVTYNATQSDASLSPPTHPTTIPLPAHQ